MFMYVCPYISGFRREFSKAKEIKLQYYIVPFDVKIIELQAAFFRLIRRSIRRQL